MSVDNTLQEASLKILLWNIQFLGGGPSRGPRTEDQLKEIAAIIAKEDPDLVVILEVMTSGKIAGEKEWSKWEVTLYRGIDAMMCRIMKLSKQDYLDCIGDGAPDDCKIAEIMYGIPEDVADSIRTQYDSVIRSLTIDFRYGPIAIRNGSMQFTGSSGSVKTGSGWVLVPPDTSQPGGANVQEAPSPDPEWALEGANDTVEWTDLRLKKVETAMSDANNPQHFVFQLKDISVALETKKQLALLYLRLSKLVNDKMTGKGIATRPSLSSSFEDSILEAGQMTQVNIVTYFDKWWKCANVCREYYSRFEREGEQIDEPEVSKLTGINEARFILKTAGFQDGSIWPPEIASPDLIQEKALPRFGETIAFAWKHSKLAAPSPQPLALAGFLRRPVYQIDFKLVAPASGEFRMLGWHAPSNCKKNEPARINDFEVLRQILNGTPYPSLTLGDFNIPTNIDQVAKDCKIFFDTFGWPKDHFRTLSTLSKDRFCNAFDKIFFNRNHFSHLKFIKPLDKEVFVRQYSDHIPVTLNLPLKLFESDSFGFAAPLDRNKVERTSIKKLNFPSQMDRSEASFQANTNRQRERRTAKKSGIRLGSQGY